MPAPKKVQAMPPTSHHELRSFIVIINYYRDLWIRGSDVIAPLSRLLSKDDKCEWTEVEANAFETINRIIVRDVLLAHPDFSEAFEIHTDASKYRFEGAILQGGRSIAFYSCKLTSAQQNYTTTEKELLAIVETFKEFRNILMGQRIVVYTDYKNLTYKAYNTEPVICRRLIFKQYMADLQYIRRSHNIIGNA